MIINVKIIFAGKKISETDGKLRMKSDEERTIFIFLVEDTTNRSLS